ncbi:ABC transporter permease [Anaerotaenia torta]|uniref:ABC transporter permease n=1 Tax=Anaerotaenia torta TaxID=433293 RepID=UPI003D1E0B67
MPKSKKKGFLYEIKKNKSLLFMAMPVVLYFFIFHYLPMSGIIIAFKDYNYKGGIFFSPWAAHHGFENFRFFFLSGKAWSIIRNTVTFNLIFMLVTPLFSMSAAILISEMSGKYFKKISQTMMFLPYSISWVVVGTFMYSIFNYEHGLLNSILHSLNLAPVDVYSKPNLWYFIMPVVNIWKGIGYGSILYLASIMGMDQECFEAARVDGANVFQKIFYITIPNLMPTYVTLLLLALGRVFRGNFEEFYNLVSNVPTLMERTDVIDTFVFRSLMQSSDFGMVSAASVLQSVLCFVAIVTVNSILKHFKSENTLF